MTPPGLITEFSSQRPRSMPHEHAELISLAHLPAPLGPAVWIGSDAQCLQDEELVHLPPGVVVWFLPEGEAPPVPYTLGQLLLSRDVWSADSVVPVAELADALCVVHQGVSQLHIPESHHPGRYRRDIAAATDVCPHNMRLYAADPRPRDAACHGVSCSAVLSVAGPVTSGTGNLVIGALGLQTPRSWLEGRVHSRRPS